MPHSYLSLDLASVDTALNVHHVQILAVACAVLGIIGTVFAFALQTSKDTSGSPSLVRSFGTFFYASFLKPYAGDNSGTGQQAALESFYKAQADVYDATRKRLLRGREDMLGLVAAQLRYKVEKDGWGHLKPTWVDIGGGTGYNIEAMQAYVDVPSFFSNVYLVDLSPSLCEVARKRFVRLGWKNVTVVCEDARTFRLEDQEHDQLNERALTPTWDNAYDFKAKSVTGRADLITLSYSLSMIPGIDDLAMIKQSDVLTRNAQTTTPLSTLCPTCCTLGAQLASAIFMYKVLLIVSPVTILVESSIDTSIGLGECFGGSAWFDVDRVGLEAARRDYLEYRFGTVLSASDRNYLLGGIPYYIWVGCPKQMTADSTNSTRHSHEVIEQLDAGFTESPYLSPSHHTCNAYRVVEKAIPEIRSKAYECAVINLAGNLPLPSSFYQHHHWRIHYDDQLRKHLRFGNEYIYAFTWEDPRVDHRLLKIGEDDVILCITSAGDNVLDYLLSGNPRRLHAVDLNPNQNHLLELKVASFQALSYADFWQLFGVGKHPKFRELLISRLSPFLSSRALQYWLVHSKIFTSYNGYGLYESGSSGNALRLVRWLFWSLGLSREVEKLCSARTLNEQREIWCSRIRGVLLSRVLSWAVVGTEWFAWKAAGVPPTQCKMIQTDYLEQEGVACPATQRSDLSGQAMWEYLVNTLDPVVGNTLIGGDNYFYLLCLRGQYSRRCHPTYLTPKSHAKLTRPGAFDGLRMHTDCLDETLSRISPGTLTIAVVMDSMDWFSPNTPNTEVQVKALNVALKLGGRVLLRSAGLKP
ncbi:MAG: hypothetical protein M1830_004092, partial [Pleopsidium flavum]